MPISDTLKTLIRNAWDDGYPCPGAHQRPRGAEPDAQGQHDRVRRRASGLVGAQQARGAGQPVATTRASLRHVRQLQGAARRACSRAEFCGFFRSGRAARRRPVRDKIFSMLVPREQTHVGAEAGSAVLVKNREGDRS